MKRSDEREAYRQAIRDERGAKRRATRDERGAELRVKTRAIEPSRVALYILLK